MTITGETIKTRRALGFRAGLAQVQMGQYPEVRQELCKALGITNRNSFAAYASGRQEMKVTQADAVEGVFERYGVTQNIWGDGE